MTKLNRLVVFLALTVLIVFFSSCGDDASSTMDPEEVVVVTSIQLQRRDTSPASEIPELKKIAFDVFLGFNNGSRRAMTEAELNTMLTWDVSSSHDVSIIKCDDTPGAIKLQGEVGVDPQNVDVNVRYRADVTSGKMELLSNNVPLTLIKAKLVSIEVKPASDYSVGCSLSTENNTRLLEGCLMQFQTVGYFDNDSTSDLTESDDVTWFSPKPSLADFVDVSADITKEWWSNIRNYLVDNNLGSKKGLILGKSIGAFTIATEYQGKESTSDNVNVIGPSLRIISISVQDKDQPNQDKCLPDELCQLYDNTKVQFKALGTYNNNFQKNITYSSSWFSSDTIVSFPEPTGLAEIDGSSPVNIIITAVLGVVSDTFTVNVNQETLQGIKLGTPDTTNDTDKMSNKDIPFRVMGIFNNDDFEILDQNLRIKSLNLDLIEWVSSDPGVATIDVDNWATEGAVIIKTTNAAEGTTNISATWKSGEELFAWPGFNWTIHIDNTFSTPISLTISPSDSSDDLTAEAGVDIPLSAVATFSNDTSRILNTGEVSWSSDPVNCIVYSTPQPCISASGLATTYNDLEITATFDGSNDISANLTLHVDDTQLDYITVIPANQSVRELTTIQYTAVGHFQNNKSHSLPQDCFNWNVSPDNAIIDSQGILTTIDTIDDVLVTATTILNCGGSLDKPVGRSIPGDMSSDTHLRITPLPSVNLEEVSTPPYTEDFGEVTIKATADITHDSDITVPFVVSGTSSSTDHTLEPGFITINAGDTEGTTTFSIINDELDEYSETIIIDISADSIINAKLGANPGITLTILDNDGTPVVSFAEASNDVYEDVGTVYMELVLDPVSGRDVTVYYEITDSSCDNQDHTLTSGSLTIPAGQSSAFISFDISNDTWKENNEAFTITIDFATNANSVAPLTHTITIIDNDALTINRTTNPNCTFPCSEYSLKPTINKAIGNVTFYIVNKPEWLAFDEETGELTFDSGDATSANEIYICAIDSEDNESVCLTPFDIIVTP